MKNHSRGSLVVLSMSFAALLAFSGLSWACTNQAKAAFSANAGPAGTHLTIIGSSFEPLPVEIRWGSLDGPILETGAGPEFSVGITVPSGAVSGVHYVVAIQKDPGGEVLNKAVETFQVRRGVEEGKKDASSAGDLWQGMARGLEAETVSLNQQDATSSDAQKALLAGLGLAATGSVFLLVAAFTAKGRRKATSGSR